MQIYKETMASLTKILEREYELEEESILINQMLETN